MNPIPESPGGGQPDPRRQWSNIPPELRERPQWALAAPGLDKRPRTISGGYASSTDPTTWTDFESACRSAAARGWVVGYVLTANDPFTCIDLDVKDNTPPEQIERFNSMLEQFDSYAERSLSGVGLHIWAKGNVGRGHRRDGVEVYSQERFIICTGEVVRNQPIANRADLLANLVSRMEPARPAELDVWGEDKADPSVVARALADAGELGRLFAGDWQGRYPSQSEADLALVKLLAPLTGSPRNCWATFRESKLGQREKAGRPDYMKRTLGLAAQHVANDTERAQHGREVAAALLGPDDPTPALQPSRTIRLLVDDELDRLPPLRWLVKGIIPDAGIGAIYGDSGTFKSFLALDLLAHISNGQEWFGHRVRAAPAVYVPFEGQGGIPNRIKAWRLAQTAIRNPDMLIALEPDPDAVTNIAVLMDSLNLREQSDREALVATLIDKGWAGGVLNIDTLAHASNGIEENSSAMGEMIGIFRDLQRRLGGVILLVHHSGKDQSKGMRGWSGLHAAMDFVIECQREGDGEAREAQFRLSKVKDGTTGTVFKFRMQQVPLGFDEDGEGITSLSVCPREDRPADDSPPFKGFSKAGIREIDADTSAKDDAFMLSWVVQQVVAGNFPSKNSLKGQLPEMKETGYQITQDRVLAAVERLLAVKRLSVEKTIKSPSGNVWIRPIEDGPGSLA